jgi:hypothetical protein
MVGEEAVLSAGHDEGNSLCWTYRGVGPNEPGEVLGWVDSAGV